jgi:hypothetical protein
MDTCSIELQIDDAAQTALCTIRHPLFGQQGVTYPMHWPTARIIRELDAECMSTFLHLLSDSIFNAHLAHIASEFAGPSTFYGQEPVGFLNYEGPRVFCAACPNPVTEEDLALDDDALECHNCLTGPLCAKCRANVREGCLRCST